MTTPTAVAARVSPRAGLGELCARLRRQELTIAYLGASVTAQKDGYRPRLHELIRRSSAREHRSVDAGTGAMGAITGVFLMDDLVLAHRPDLCFVEYATSDAAGTTPLPCLEPAVDGIVRKLLGAGCSTCLIYLYRSDGELRRGGPVVETYERVADRHGVPSIDLATPVGELVRSGRLEESELLRDVVHTTPAGSDLVAAAILDALELLGSAKGGHRPSAGPPLRQSFERTRIVAASPALAADPAACALNRFRLTYRYLEVDSSNELRFRTPGELVGLLAVVGPSSGHIRVEADGVASEYLLWDEQCRYDRLGSVIFTPFAPAGTQVTVRLLDRPVDCARARTRVHPDALEKRLRVVGLMVRA